MMLVGFEDYGEEFDVTVHRNSLRLAPYRKLSHPPKQDDAKGILIRICMVAVPPILARYGYVAILILDYVCT